MASWIKMRTNLLTHPKVVRLASGLNVDRLTVAGGLFAVWSLFDEHSTDGRLDGYTAQAMDELIRFPGFSAALVAVQWLEIDESGVCTPRFSEHNGQSAKVRAQDARLKRASRAASGSGPDSVRADAGQKTDQKRKEKNRTTPKGVDKDIGSSDADPTPPTTGEPAARPAPPPAPPPPPPEKAKRKLGDYSDDFEAAWAAYPDRPGKSKTDAWKAWSARINAGVAPEALLLGVERYAAYCVAERTESHYVKQPATFFGPGEHYLSDWTPALRRTPLATPAQARRDQKKAWVQGLINPESTPQGGSDAAHQRSFIDAEARVIG